MYLILIYIIIMIVKTAVITTEPSTVDLESPWFPIFYKHIPLRHLFQNVSGVITRVAVHDLAMVMTGRRRHVAPSIGLRVWWMWLIESVWVMAARRPHSTGGRAIDRVDVLNIKKREWSMSWARNASIRAAGNNLSMDMRGGKPYTAWSTRSTIWWM
jgi:hypothetical protein